MNELKDTIEMMTSADYKERFKAEYLQLTIRITKLDKMLLDYVSGVLPFKPKCSSFLLSKQLDSMIEYQEYLKIRAELEGINLKE